jgi:hypothetical protein
MLPRYRRILGPLAFCLLAAPLVVGFVAPDSPASVFREGRSLAPAPRVPTTGASGLALPAAVNAYVKDHFGLARENDSPPYRLEQAPVYGWRRDMVDAG